MKEYNKKDAKFYGNMFSKMKKLESLDCNVSILFMLFLLYIFASGYCMMYTVDLIYIIRISHMSKRS